MKRILALLSMLFVLSPVLAQPVASSPGTSLPPIPFPLRSESTSPLTITQGNCFGCAGYAGMIASGYITKITSQWTVPTVTCQPGLTDDQELGFEIGVGGVDSATTYSTGVIIEALIYCGEGTSTPYVNTMIFYESAVTGGAAAWSLPFVLTSGHKLSVTITLAPSTGKMTATLKDATDGQSMSFTTLMSYWGVDYNYVNQAVWGVYRGAPDLAKFNPSIKFTKCDVVVSGATHPISWISNLYEFTMVDNAGTVTQATPSALNGAGTGFSVTFASST